MTPSIIRSPPPRNNVRFSPPSPFVFGVPVLPAGRVIAIDAGSPEIKVVLAQLFLNRVTILKRETLAEPAALADQDNGAAELLAATCRRLGGYPVALALPQHLTLSQVIELPAVPRAEVRKLIENETVTLSGLSETKITYDYAALAPFGQYQHPYWITLCQEKEFAAAVQRAGLAPGEVCDVTSVGNALRAAYLERIPSTVPTVLADISVRSTTVVILHKGQAVHISSFGMGSEMLFEPVISERNCTPAEAAEWGRANNLFAEPQILAGLPFLVDSWHDELVRVIREWLSDHSDLALELETFQFVLSGGGAVFQGLVPYLNQRFGAPRFLLWPGDPEFDPPVPGHYAVAIGTAIQALGKNPQSASLLPAPLRAHWKAQKTWQRLQSVCFLLLLLLAVFLGFGTWNKLSLAHHKASLIRQAELALEKVTRNEKLLLGLSLDYERIRPALEYQRRTIDTLQTLAALNLARSNRVLWLGLFADQPGYFNAPMDTNGLTVAASTTLTRPPASSSTATNLQSIQPHLIAEIGMPEGGEAMRQALSTLVADFKKNPRFHNVDILPAEQHRAPADYKVTNPDHYFTIAFELADKEFRRVDTTGRIANPRGLTNNPVKVEIPAPTTLLRSDSNEKEVTP
jgi:Tfp pilus assembly PilM family ATPase